MRLFFHYTSEQHWPLVQRHGISRCVIPWRLTKRGPTLVHGYQWLTTNPRFEDQEWGEPAKLPIRKSDIRITLEIPKALEYRLTKWTEFCLKSKPASAEFINTGFDFDNWWLYYGKIPPRAFIAVDRNPILRNLNPDAHE